ncbi:MAG: hypothetical protein ACRDMV_24965 [Streptosporangiales bacterium]
MSLAELTLIVYVATAWYLVGTVWFGQRIHFPLFQWVGADEFPGYIAAHYRSFGPVLWPAIALNALALVVMLLGLRPEGVSLLMILVGLALAIITGANTAAMVVPRLIRLGSDRDEATLRSLVRVHWIRTASQSANGVLALVMLAVSG